MTYEIKSYCSWCFALTKHFLVERRRLRLNVYQCEECRNFTVQCMHCLNMAQAAPGPGDKLQVNGGRKRNKDKRPAFHAMCAEHNGTVASFEALASPLDDIEDFEVIFERRAWNLNKTAKICAGAGAGALVLAPMAAFGAAGIASSLGVGNLLGTASTGTAISTLSGAALSNASLAAIGGGTVAGGVVVVSSVGAGLGAAQGAAIANAYVGKIKNFRITKHNEGDDPAVIFINGFTQEKEDDVRDWKRGLRSRFLRNPWYHLDWESKTRYDLGKLVGTASSEQAFTKMAINMAKFASKKGAKKLAPIAWATLVLDLIRNPWHNAMVKAAMTGQVLADLMSRAEPQRFILMGHSLGARVVFYTLCALSTRGKKIVDDAYLFGGAVGAKPREDWLSAARAVSGTIHNCLSLNDDVLRWLYRPANLGQSQPVGLQMIDAHDPQIFDHNLSNLVDGHMRWKEKLIEAFEAVRDSNEKPAASKTEEIA